MDVSSSGNINYVSVNNSTTTPLGIGATFTGTADSILVYKSVVLTVFTDVDSAANGVVFQFSQDGTNWDFIFNFSVIGNIAFSQTLQSLAPYFRIVYTNGSSAQTTFRLQVMYVASQNAPNSTYPVSNVKATQVNVSSPIDSFGDMAVTEKTASSLMDFVYNINSSIATSTVTGSGTITQANANASLNTAASAGTAELQSTTLTPYTTGVGVRVYITGVYNTGVAGTSQLIGAGSSTNGYFFGYTGTTFAILHRNNSVDTYIPQSSWNVDTFDGNGESRITLNPQLGNVYSIKIQWLGYGAIRFFIESPFTGIPILVHVIRYPNTATVPNLNKTGFYGLASLNNGVTATAMSMKVGCVSIFLEGDILERPGLKFAARNSTTVASSTLQSVLTIRNKSTFASTTNFTPIIVDLISLSTEGNKPVRFDVFRNPVNVFTYTDVATNNSVIEFATDVLTISTGVLIFSFYLGKADSKVVNISSELFFIYPGQNITFAALTSNATNENGISISWRELF